MPAALTPPPYIDRVGVGWQRHCETCRSPRELDNQGTFFVFGGHPQLVVELDDLCEVKNLYSAQQVGIILSRSVQGKTPKRKLHSTPLAVSGIAYTGN